MIYYEEREGSLRHVFSAQFLEIFQDKKQAGGAKTETWPIGTVGQQTYDFTTFFKLSN